MKLKDLKQGMVCKLRSGESMTILNSEYYFINGWEISTLGGNYNEDLTHRENKQLDIMEVSFGNEVVFERKESRWYEPEIGERYYFLSNYGETVLSTNDRSETDYEVFDNCKVFKTKEEVEKRLKQQQATLSVERWIAENDVEIDVCDKYITKYYIVYDIEDKELDVGYYNLYMTAPKQFILSSEEKAEQLIEEREKELKIMLGVEE